MNDVIGMSDCFPLSHSQWNIWNLEQSFCGTSINNICETIRIKGVLDVVLLQDCLNRILKSDPSLRIQITLDENRQPVQYEKEYEESLFPVFDFSATNLNGFTHWENSVTRQVMPILEAPLYYFAIVKLSEHEGGVFVKTHHIISDGWSQVSLINRIAQTYLALLNREEPVLPSMPDYRLHVEKEQQYLSSAAAERDRKFWQELLHNSGQAVSLKEHLNAELSPVGQRKTFYLSEKLNHALNAFCTKHRVAPFAVFYMAMAIYLKRIRGVDRLCIGAPIHNRTDVVERQMTGMFVSTLPFFTQLDENWSFEEFNRHLAEDWLDLLRHQRLPFSEIASVAKQAQVDFEKPFRLVLSFHNSKAYRNRDTSVTFSGQWHYAGYQAEHICIHLNNIEDERRYSVNYDYLSQLYSKHEIEDFHYYILHILTQVLAAPKRPIGELSVLSEEEEEKVLYSFNRTDAFYYEGSLGQKLEEICLQYPKRVAVIDSGQRHTYRGLHKRAAAIATELLRSFPSGKKIVAIFLPKSYDLLCAMAGIIYAGCAWVILSPQLPKNRLLELLSDSDAAAMISTKELTEHFFGEELLLPIINIEEVSATEVPFSPCPVTTEELAYLVYTSGSTGTPKGVEIEQHSLLNFAEAMAPLYGKGAVLSLCNISFDAFILESVVSLLNGRTIVLPTEQEQENPSRLAELIRSYAVGFVAMTPSRLIAYLKNTAFSAATVGLETIVCGGEAFPPELLKTLSRCTGARIYNQYGPSETTIGVSTDLLNGAPFICVGAPMQNCRFYVLDRSLRPLPIGVYGDLYIGGACVGRGYHHASELTEKAFIANPYETGERLYRTGDIAAWTDNGKIMLKGREDGQIKLRGQRIEPEEISSCLMRHPSVRQAVVRLSEIEEQPLLVAYYTAEQPLSDAELLEFAATYLPGYMIPSIFQQVEEIPLTSNGKVDASLLPIPALKHTEALDGALSQKGERILSVFRRVLNRPDMTASDDYFLFGGDSLNAMETLSELETAFGIRLRVADLYACRTAIRLETRLSKEHIASDTPPEEIRKAPISEYYPLTPAQRGIYLETQKAPRQTTYNMPCGFAVGGAVEENRLRNAVQNLIDTESVLRTAFVMRQNGICQQISAAATADFEVFEGISLEKAKELFVKPFDLSRPPLLRVALWKAEEGDSVIMLDMHHIVGDAVTAFVMLNRLSAFYEGREAVYPAVTFADYAYWLNRHQNEWIRAEDEYWKGQLENAPKLPELPVDFPRKKQFDYVGADLEVALTARESLLCDTYCERKKLTPYMFFVGAFGIFLSKLSGSKDMMVGTPISSRRSASVSETAGLFVNTLPLRLALQNKMSVSAYLEQVKKSTIELLDHPYTPLEHLVSLSGQNSLYNTIVSIRPVDIDQLSFAGQMAKPESVPAKTAKTDLNLEIYKSQGCYRFRIEYASSLFDAKTVALYGRSFLTVVKNMLREENALLEECDVISDYDRYYLVELPHTMRVPFSHLPIDGRIDAMAKIHSEQTALIFHDRKWTFGEIKTRSDAVAAALMKSGIKKGDTVGLLCHRSPQLLIGMLGVLKTGAAYLPMLPKYPTSRLKYMLEVSATALTLCDSETMQALPEGLSCRWMDIGSAAEEKAVFTPPTDRTSDDICCVLFTSGSTGNPKGVMLRHRSICNLMAVLYPMLSEADGGYLCTANSVFDIFTTETLIAMAFGRYSVLADEEETVLPWKAAELIRKHHVRLIEFTPSRAQLFLENRSFCEAISDIPVAMMCGEVLLPQLLQKLREVGCRRIFNLYGPTETTVYSTMDDVTNADRITVGKMYPNCRGYVLDDDLRPVMPTAVGELYFAGECLAAGYIGQKELTEAAFLPDPFYPGEKMYRSGDMVRQLPDGRLDFIGRRDHQVKLNGQRIELGEITQKILDSGYAVQAATIVKKEGQFMQLCAFAEPPRGTALDLTALRGYLKKELPNYMIPSELHEIETMPCTASGKVDFAVLQSYASSALKKHSAAVPTEAAVRDTDCPATENAVEQLPKLWREALSAGAVASEVSFFEQGGTSLSALSLLSSYYNLGLNMTLADFYEHPTLKEQLDFFRLTERENQPPKQVTLLQDECPTPTEQISKEDKSAVFLTGATGFLGAHLLKALLEAGYSKVFCLLRGERDRLERTLEWYFGKQWLHSVAGRIEAVQGDMTQEQCGLSDAALAEVCRSVAYVVHAAADVRHYACDDTPEKTNCAGTAQALVVAEKAQAKFVHISTVSLCGEYLPQEPATVRHFSELDFEIGQNWRDSVYLRGKYGAEKLVRQAAEKGMNTLILRVGRLVGRSSDGVFQRNAESNAFFGMVRGMLCLDKVSTALATLPLEMTAVDDCARAAVLLMQSEKTVYHLFNPNTLTVQDILKAIGRPLPVTDETIFEQHLKEKCRAGFGVKLAPLLSQYQRLMQIPIRITPTCDVTERELKKYDFVWQSTDPTVLLHDFLRDI